MHTFLFTCLNLAGNLNGFVLSYEITDSRIGDHDLCCNDTSCTVSQRYQLLGNNALQHIDNLGTHLILSLQRAGVDDSFHRLCSTGRMQSSQHQMSCFRCRNRCGYGLIVTHLSHQDNIGILTKGRAECRGKAVHILAKLSLVNHSPVVRIDILNRILYGHDMFREISIDVVYNGSQCRRLTTTRRSGNKHKSSGKLCEILYHGRESQLIKSRNIVLQKTYTGCKVVSLMVNVCSDANTVLIHITDIQVISRLNILHLLRIQNRINHLLTFCRTYPFRQNLQRTKLADCHIGAHRQVNIGAFLSKCPVNNLF